MTINNTEIETFIKSGSQNYLQEVTFSTITISCNDYESTMLFTKKGLPCFVQCIYMMMT